MTLRERLCLLVSQAVNAVFCGGDPDESLSARAWRQQEAPWPGRRELIDRWLGRGHCQRVFEAQKAREKARAQ